MRKTRLLTQALLFSVALNIGLVATFLSRHSQEKIAIETPPKLETVLTEQATLQSVLAEYSVLSFQELLARLGDKEHVEEGFSRRDLALACLVAFHHFNLERALGGLQLQKRSLYFANPVSEEMMELTAFSDLADYQYLAIVQYAETERWPLTPQGLFLAIQAAPEPTLLEAFYLTPQFHFIHTLFTKTGATLKKELLVQFVAEGNWILLEEWTEILRKSADFSIEERRAVLVRYFQNHSKTAATLLAQLDPDFVLKKFDDRQLLQLLELVPEEAAAPLLQAIRESQRSDRIQAKAAMQPPVPQQEEPLAYIVQPGDSLWKISRRFKVPIETLMRHNQLDSEKLRVGKTLQIPQG